MLYDKKKGTLLVDVWDWYSIEEIVDALNTIKPKTFIYCGQTEHSLNAGYQDSRLLKLDECIRNNKIKGYIISGATNIDSFTFDHKLYLSSFEFLFVPLRFLEYTVNAFDGLGMDPGLDTNLTLPRQLFYSQVNRSHPFRAKMVDNLVKYDLNREGVGKFTWNQLSSEYWDPYNPGFKYWKEERILADDDFESDRSKFSPYKRPEELYFESLWDLVQESSDDTIFITEKTIKAILWQKPFIVYGAKGFHRALESLGFKLFDELIDYTFDDVEDMDIKSELIAKELFKLQHIPLDKQLEIVASKAKHNKIIMLNYYGTKYSSCIDFLKNYFNESLHKYLETY